jgi:AraC family transcriptional regulator
MLRATLVVLLLGIIFLGTFFFFRLGYYKPIEMSEKTIPSTVIVFSEHMGPYHKIVPIIERVESWAKSQGLSCRYSFGEYFDDPKITDEVRLRSRGGCILEPSEVKPNSLTGLAGAQIDEWKERKVVEAVFEGSPSLGPTKVYPKIRDYLKDARLQSSGSIVEIYELLPGGGVRTRYQFTLL